LLTDQEKIDIDAAAAMYETRSAAAVEALRTVQEARGWVSDEGLADIADYLDVSPAYLEGLATFYSMVFRLPVGRHVIMVCNSVCCWMQGSEEVMSYISDKLGVEPGGTTSEGRFTLLPVVCIGACHHAPAMLVDGALHGDLTPGKIDMILAEHK
jgi:NADH-quinone oxidoreductase subunit E